MMETGFYQVACIQNTTRVVVSNDPKEQEQIVAANVSRLKELIEWTVHQTGGRAKLFVTGEYALTGTYRPRTVDEWLRLALVLPNGFTDTLGAVAREFDCYIATQFMEQDPAFPGVFFDTAFILNPKGEIALRYRKHNGPNNVNVQYVGPGDVYDRYVAEYGVESLFPVLDTPIGKLGCFICYDLNFPEVARCLALNGAEVLIHLTASSLTLSRHWDELKVARAVENVAYVVSADSGPWIESRWPVHYGQGSSSVISFSGDTIACTNGPGERVITADIDLEALRRRRVAMHPHQNNPYYQLRSSLYAKEYARAAGWPLNSFDQEPMRDKEQARAIGARLLHQAVDRGQLKSPRLKETEDI